MCGDHISPYSGVFSELVNTVLKLHRSQEYDLWTGPYTNTANTSTVLLFLFWTLRIHLYYPVHVYREQGRISPYSGTHEYGAKIIPFTRIRFVNGSVYKYGEYECRIIVFVLKTPYSLVLPRSRISWTGPYIPYSDLFHAVILQMYQTF